MSAAQKLIADCRSKVAALEALNDRICSDVMAANGRRRKRLISPEQVWSDLLEAIGHGSAAATRWRRIAAALATRLRPPNPPHMKGSDPEFVEAARLIREFFPETAATATPEAGLTWETLWLAMSWCDFHLDCTCVEKGATGDVSRLYELGGVEGTDEVVYLRILRLTGFQPSGRVVVIPDSLGPTSRSLDIDPPFVCHSRTLAERLRERDGLFGCGNDTLIVFESGEAIVVNHDSYVCWSKSKLRRWSEPVDAAPSRRV
jgi:hypothetical protein